jgi:hypothetical protein
MVLHQMLAALATPSSHIEHRGTFPYVVRGQCCRNDRLALSEPRLILRPILYCRTEIKAGIRFIELSEKIIRKAFGLEYEAATPANDSRERYGNAEELMSPSRNGDPVIGEVGIA